MKQFVIFTVKTLVLLFLLLVVLDFMYTTVYLQASNRGKVDYVYNSKPRNYDVVILGSSRANNHFVTQLFQEKGLKTFNYGMSGGHLFEASLLLKLMVERNYSIQNIIIETDLNLSNEDRSDAVAAKFLPYLHQSTIIKNHFSEEDDFLQLYCIPFYRYVKFDASIGFREMYNSFMSKPTNTLKKGGFYALGNKKGNMKNDIRALKPIHNKYYEEIKQICATNNINLIAVMTPMCSNTKGLDYFEKANKIYPEIHNYENAVEGDECFSSCGHLNDTGARLFTRRILKDFF
ncbi:hypothetical protein SAMN05444395_103344 [Flavobacterium fryxellicola]|uniref:SGNH/GDSL hydrolase family protein n=1 Tax=Flavobacterium fryxellicola TaxID=249352 RepID=A0A167VZQ7_9FLAO|nr:hypothetical protein [Flavobacterium fryxellicola]OAB26886.1 hypothetical protein FBFR_12670 [Flavobacterium fryxellicola]SHN66176.1 hypothetical protein SAMN05444395_103344 [Flavobacterium fryxellicola]